MEARETSQDAVMIEGEVKTPVALICCPTFPNNKGQGNAAPALDISRVRSRAGAGCGLPVEEETLADLGPKMKI